MVTMSAEGSTGAKYMIAMARTSCLRAGLDVPRSRHMARSSRATTTCGSVCEVGHSGHLVSARVAGRVVRGIRIDR